MSTNELQRVDADDEQRHPEGPERLWNESYYMDFVSDDGDLAGYIRLGFYPNMEVAWWTTALVRPGGPTILSVAYDLVPSPLPSLSVAGPSCSVELQIPNALRTFAVRAEATGQQFEDPTAIYRGEDGEPVSIGLDLSWITDGVPFHYEVTTRYEIPCLIEGTVVLDGAPVAFHGQGQRDHSWGVRDWWAFGWCWLAARFEDGTRLHCADIRMPDLSVAFGYLQKPGGSVEKVAELTVTEDLGIDGLPTRGRVQMEPGGIDAEITPIAFAPILLVSEDGRTSRFPRALARFTQDDGSTATGWIEWNQPQGA